MSEGVDVNLDEIGRAASGLRRLLESVGLKCIARELKNNPLIDYFNRPPIRDSDSRCPIATEALGPVFGKGLRQLLGTRHVAPMSQNELLQLVNSPSVQYELMARRVAGLAVALEDVESRMAAGERF